MSGQPASQAERLHDDERTADMLREYRRTGDRTLRNRVVEEYYGLAVAQARNYDHTSEPLADRTQVALVGLMKAANRFDPDYGSTFAAFARVTVRGELQRHFRDHGWGVRVPRRVQELRYRVRAATDLLSERLHRSPRPAEIAAHLGVTVHEVVEALCADDNYRPRRIESTPGGRGPIDVVPAATDPGFEAVESEYGFGRLLELCPPRLQRVLRMRFVEGLKQSEIAEQMGVSQVQVSRLLRQAIALLRQRPEVAESEEAVAS